MTRQLSTLVRNAMLDAIETTIGATAKLLFYTGTQPAATTDAASGTLLATITLPTDWWAAASSGSKTLLGSWAGTGSVAGLAGYYRLCANDGTTCGEQGTVTATGGGGDLTLDNANIGVGQAITITTWTRTAPNA